MRAMPRAAPGPIFRLRVSHAALSASFNADGSFTSIIFELITRGGLFGAVGAKGVIFRRTLNAAAQPINLYSRVSLVNMFLPPIQRARGRKERPSPPGRGEQRPVTALLRGALGRSAPRRHCSCDRRVASLCENLPVSRWRCSRQVFLQGFGAINEHIGT